MEEKIKTEKIKKDIRNQFMFDHLKIFDYAELDKLINQIITEESINLEDIHSFLLLENRIGKDLSDMLISYFGDYDFDNMEYNNFIENLSYNDLLLMETVLSVYSRPELQKANWNSLSNILQPIIKQCRNNDILVRNRRIKDNEAR